MPEVTIELKYPIKAEGKELHELVLTRPKAKHFKNIRMTQNAHGGTDLEMKDMLKLIASLANIPPSSVDNIDMVDMEEIGQAIEGMMGKSKKAGKAI